MRTLLLSLSAAGIIVAAAGCACGTKKADGAKPGVTPTPVQTPSQGHIPSILEPNHGMSASRAAGFGKAAEFLK
jgi:hypothetical protein